MKRSGSANPLDRLSFRERRQWRAAERRATRQHDEEQMAALLNMAASGTGVTGLKLPDLRGSEYDQVSSSPVEMIIAGRRLRATRAHRRTVARLREAISGIAGVPLTAVGRYGPYWVLTFKLATEQLVLLVEHLTIVPDWGPGGRSTNPVVGPLASLGV